MLRRLPNLAPLLTLLTVFGCAPRTHVKPAGPDYTLVWHDPVNPDEHPATALHYKNKEVWPAVYEGYGYFFQDGVMVFVGLVPIQDSTGCYSYGQVFAVRGDSPALVLSQRLLRRRLTVSDGFGVHSLSWSNGTFRAQFQFAQSTNISTREFTWSDVKGFLEEGESLPRLMRPLFPVYRMLP